MRVVVDANILAAALIRPDGWTAGQLAREDLTFLIPYTVTEELKAHMEIFAEKAELNLDEAEQRVKALATRLEIIGEEALRDARSHPLVARADRVDPDDAPYMAAFVAADAAFLWTRDGAILDAFPTLAVEVVPDAQG